MAVLRGRVHSVTVPEKRKRSRSEEREGSRGRVALPGRVQWRLSPGWLAASVRLQADCCTPQGPLAARVRWQRGGVQVAVEDGQSAWPAALLAGLGTLWNTVQLQGDITLRTHGLSFGWVQGRLHLQGQAGAPRHS